VLLAGVYQLGGWTGLALLRAALVAISFGLLGATLRSIGCGARPATILTLLAFIVAAPALALRPQLFAICLFAMTTWILASRREHPRRLWLIPVIALAWANLHGSFPLVLVLLALGWLEEMLRARVPDAAGAGVTTSAAPASSAARGRSAAPAARGAPAARERLLGSTGIALIGAVSAVATLITPFGIDTWRYVVDLAANPAVSSRVSEWRPPSPLDPAGALFYLSLAAVLVVVVLRIRADGGLKRERLAPFAWILIFGALGVVTGRGLAWWALVAPVAAVNLAHEGGLTAQLPRAVRLLGVLFRDSPPRRSTRGNRLNGVLAAVLILAGVALLPFWRGSVPPGLDGTVSYAPSALTGELRNLLETGRIPLGARTWNPQVWGSWLEWSVPELSYAVDSRIELFPAGLWDDLEQVATMHGDWRPILDKYEVDVVVLTPEQLPIAEGLDDEPTWVVLYQEADGSIVARP
jgi:hypothetical protein